MNDDDFFARKAKQDYEEAWRNKAKVQGDAFNESYLERRIKEAGWLMKKVKHPDDEVEQDPPQDQTQNHPPFDSRPKSRLGSIKKAITALAPPTPGELKKKLFQHTLTDDELVEQKRLEEAQTLKELDRAQKREHYLQEKVKKIRVLERVVNWLSVPRQPAHHVKLPEVHNEQTIEEQERNLRNYRMEKPQPIIEQLKPMEQVMAEDRAARMFRVGGRHHLHLGAEKIYPLLAFPATLSALLPLESSPSLLPELSLLPSEQEREEQREQQRAKEKEKRRRVYRVKKDRLDMSRVAVITDQPPKERRDKKHVQFKWREKRAEERDSVFSYPHPPVEFKEEKRERERRRNQEEEERGGQRREESVASNTLPSSLSFHLAPSLSSVEGGGEGTEKEGEGVGEEGEDSSSLLYSSASLLSLERSYGSGRGIRNNFFSEGSRCSQGRVRVQLARHRQVKGLDRYVLKERPALLSLRKKGKILRGRAESV